MMNFTEIAKPNRTTPTMSPVEKGVLLVDAMARPSEIPENASTA